VASPVTAGDILADKYRVEQVLGRGGMGIVVAATHVQLGQRVALKFMLPAALESPGAAERFLREARAAVKLKSEHVARVIDVGTLDSGSPYMVMEFLEGGDLGQALEERGKLPVVEAVDYVIQACAAMAEAHGCGIVHRDLKPENLFLAKRPDGRPIVKVLDFGISKLLSGEGTSELSATRTGIAMGSPAYMAPEQMKSAKDADARADVWSMGAMLYHVLSGQLPYRAETFTEMMAKVLTENPIPLINVLRDVPPGLAHAITGCLQRDRDSRVQSVIELAGYLAPFASEEGRLIARSLVPGLKSSPPLSAAGSRPSPALAHGTAGPPRPGADSRPAAAGTAPPHVAAPNATNLSTTQPPLPRSRSGLMLLAGLALGAVITVAVAMTAGGGNDTKEESSPAASTPSDAAPTAESSRAEGTATTQEPDAAPAPVRVDAATPASIDAAVVKPDAATKKRRKNRRTDSDRDPFNTI